MFSNAYMPNSKVSQQRSKSAHRTTQITKPKPTKKNRPEQPRPEWDVYLFPIIVVPFFYLLSFSIIRLFPI